MLRFLRMKVPSACNSSSQWVHTATPTQILCPLSLPPLPHFRCNPDVTPEKPSSVNRVPLGGLDWTDHLCVSRTQQGAHCLCQELFNKGLVGRCRFFSPVWYWNWGVEWATVWRKWSFYCSSIKWANATSAPSLLILGHDVYMMYLQF